MITFETDGYLPAGTHMMTPQDFISTFCSGSDERIGFEKSVTDIFDFAQSRGAISIFIGGSFVTNKKVPADLDALIVFAEAEQIPYRIEDIMIGEMKLDILFCLEKEEKTRDALLTLFTNNRAHKKVGIIQVDFTTNAVPWTIKHEPDEDTLEIIKRAYSSRKIIDINKPKGILVTVHGIMSHASWNFDLVPIANSQGWVVAPFHYGWTSPFVLMWPPTREKILDKFRKWLHEIQLQYPDLKISIIAHSLGTYLVGAYLNGFNPKERKTYFNSIILTGSILNENYDWDSHDEYVGIVRNEIGLADNWVKLMPENYPGRDPLFGKAGVNGFKKSSDMLIQCKTKLFDHNNTIYKDVIHSSWMPFLHANKDKCMKKMLERFKKELSTK